MKKNRLFVLVFIVSFLFVEGQVYRLPFPIGYNYTCTGGNGEEDHHKVNSESEFAFDFNLSINSDVIASRGGIVHLLEEDYTDNNGGPGVNYLVIDHGDGTFGLYLHLTKDGVLVDPGDDVYQGQIVAKSGNTGNSSGPHLHFMVMNSGASWWSQSIPISFCDVSSNGGIPVKSVKYTSYNCSTNLLSPLNNSVANMHLPIDFSWEQKDGVNAYRICVATSSDGFDPSATPMFPNGSVLDIGKQEADFTSLSWTDALKDTKYYWAVRANVEGVGPVTTSIHSFTTVDLHEIAPTENATSVSVPVEFKWSSVTGANAYRINVATSPDNFDAKADLMLPTGSVLDSAKVDANFTSFTWKDALPDTKYYWVIRSNIEGIGPVTTEVHSFTTAEEPSSITESTQLKISLYPNPTTGKLQLETDIIGDYNIEITNIAGQIVHSEELKTKEAIINISDKQAGIYFIKISTEGKHSVMKVVKH